MKESKKIKFTYTSNQKHWVGDGFHVYGLLRPLEELNKFISPFIMLDYASPKEFSITHQRRGVGEHPHRGIETVTFAYQGEVEHRDSSGGGGVIKPGDVQWMTAGKGVVHDEFHSEEFSKKGGVFEMVQLWINLPRKHKMTEPKYQEIRSEVIPTISLGNNIKLRVIAGSFAETNGPSSTYTKVNLFDIISKESKSISLNFENGTNTVILIMHGELKIENKNFKDKDILIFEREGAQIDLKVSDNFKGLILNGEPINEPIVAQGPFVMNSKEEIFQAFSDYQNGKMGRL
jgi:redox-sensitive bicupin YhaK (pirin superfamily)